MKTIHKLVATECVCVCVCVCVNIKLEHTVVNKNSSDKFNIGHCPIKVKVHTRRDLEIFLHLPQYKLSSPLYQLWHML